MTIEVDYRLAGLSAALQSPVQNTGNADTLFASCLQQQLSKVESLGSVRESGSASGYEKDVAIIKEKGFTGYFKELQERKMEELREEILQAMGITEEELAKMPPEQRAAIEKLVNEEIQKRLAAQSAMDQDDEGGGQAIFPQTMPGDELGFMGLAGGGMNTGIPLMTVTDEDAKG